MELETAKAIALMVGLYCVSWLPYTVVAMIGTYGDQSQITPLTSVIPGIFAKASTVYNPIVYVLWYVDCVREWLQVIYFGMFKTQRMFDDSMYLICILRNVFFNIRPLYV